MTEKTANGLPKLNRTAVESLSKVDDDTSIKEHLIVIGEALYDLIELTIKVDEDISEDPFEDESLAVVYQGMCNTFVDMTLRDIFNGLKKIPAAVSTAHSLEKKLRDMQEEADAEAP